METPSTIEEGRPATRADWIGSPSGLADKIVDLSTWMVILGMIRLVCAIADYVIAGVDATRLEPLSIPRWSGYVLENNPIFLLGIAWPLLLGVLLRRTRWLELLKAGALTFLILSLGSVLTMVADWSDHHASRIAIGSFHVSLSALDRSALPAILLSLLGAAQLLLEFTTAVRAALLAFWGHGVFPLEGEREMQARRQRFGRLAFFTSMVFLVLMVRLPAWTAYLELLNQSRVIREFMLRDDFRRIHSSRPAHLQAVETQAIPELDQLVRRASAAWNAEKYAAAWEDYHRLAVLLESVPRSSLTGSGPFMAANALNGGAWLLATCPDTALRNPTDAVKYAHRAVELWPSEGTIWNTLGVAYYRVGDWEEARSALYRSIELRNAGEGDAFDWFFLAMIHFKLGNSDRARTWYDKAAEWSHQYAPGNYAITPLQLVELSRFEVEAAELLGLPKPDPIPARPVRPMLSPHDRPNYPYPQGIPRGGRSRIIESNMLAH